MYQKFSVTTSPETGAPRLAALRQAIAEAGLTGFLVPRSDAHQGENVAARDERLAWLTGFTGSAGSCAILPEMAGVFIDGRYRIQVKSQIDLSVFTPVHWPETEVGDWLMAQAPQGAKIGYDPMLHSFDEIDKLRKKLSSAGMSLHNTDNLIDRTWQDQPAAPQGAIKAHPIEFAGIDSETKRRRIARVLKIKRLEAMVLTLPASIAWLLNIRGNDIMQTPVALCFAVLHQDATVTLFADAGKIDASTMAHLGDDITVKPPESLGAFLNGLDGDIGVDRKTAPVWISDQLASPKWNTDPCILPKSRKNETELAGSRAAHLRDAAAMVEFLHWVDVTVPNGYISEIEVAQKLESFRRNTNALTDISFETISASGPNGAICHYRVDEMSNRTIQNPDLLLVDSGGQYLDGTTDITRTVPIGRPDADMIKMFTLVLKGMIAVSMLRWPVGRSGRDIDSFARNSLWQQGFDYDHGTGHGVGSYLGVHEGPASISPKGTVPLEPGMIMSNEPGYYREGAWGIRIENLVIVQEPTIPQQGDRKLLGFETITWVPIDQRLIDPQMLSSSELDWLNSYHRTVLEKIGPLVEGATLGWLTEACALVTL